jgi:hypothetical protein
VGDLTVREGIIAAARDDARRIERLQRKRELRGEGWNADTAYVYAVYRDATPRSLVGFIRGHLTIRRIKRWRKKHKVPEHVVCRFVQIFTAAEYARSTA